MSDPNIDNEFNEIDNFNKPKETLSSEQPKLNCPYCGAADNFSGSVIKAHKRMPLRDDISICVSCGEVVLFDIIRQATFTDWMNFQKDLTYSLIDIHQAKIKQVIRSKPVKV